jgi:hypothetical protein
MRPMAGWLLVTAVTAVTTDAWGQSTRAPVDIAGCYALSVGAWSTPLGGDEGYHDIPGLVRLDTARVETPRGFETPRGWTLSPNIAYPTSGRMTFPGTPRWEVSADTIRLIWSNGFSPTIITLQRTDSALVGEAIAETDAHPIPEPPRPRASVVARRRPCS